MRKLHGKPIDVRKLKQPVLKNLRRHLREIQDITSYLQRHEKPVRQRFCYICRSPKSKPLATIYGSQYVQCQKCQHVYTTRRYTEEAIKNFYRKNSYMSHITYANVETCFYRRDYVARPKVELALKQIRKKNGLWIDVGAGVGDLVSVLGEKRWQATGLEISIESITFAKKIFGVDLVPESLEEYASSHPELVGRVDAISFIGLIEHTVNPLDHLRLANKLLRRGGIVMVQVPNAGSLATMVQTVFPENVFRHMSPVEHIMVFTEPSLTAALVKAGFRPDLMWYHGLDMYELLNNLIMINQRVQGSELERVLMQYMNEFQQVVDDHELSDRLICIARKQK